MGKEVKIVGDGTSRLDVLIALNTKMTRGQAASLIKEGLCTVGERVEYKVSTKPPKDALVTIKVIEEKKEEILAQNIELDILYEDEYLLAINKPEGLVVHPGAGNKENTLVNGLLYHVDSLSTLGGAERPGIVHRLDKDTSGVLLIAKNDKVHELLSSQLKNRKIEKHYIAVVKGLLPQEGEINKPIARSKKNRKKMAVDLAGREALTKWTLLNQKNHCSTLDIQIITGRTHQIRVHMAALGTPVLGDIIYGGKEKNKSARLMLHAMKVVFTHPITGKLLTITAPIPTPFKPWL